METFDSIFYHRYTVQMETPDCTADNTTIMTKITTSHQDQLIIANNELALHKEEKEKLVIELTAARKELAFQKEEKGKRAAELSIANKELAYQKEEKGKRAAELGIANIELAYQDDEKGKRAAELGIANIELAYQDDEKGKRAAELGIANIELAYQDDEKEKRAAELGIANIELVFQNEEKEKRAAELSIANIELVFQNEEKEKRAAELGIANKELLFQNEEKGKRAAELGIANKELAFQNEEKEKRAAELGIANKELIFQNDEKEKRAAELSIANEELVFQNDEKEKRAAELGIANKELAFQNDEKEKRAAELIIANKELAFQNEEKEKRAAELIIANYARSLIEASLDPLVTISAAGKILDVNEASVKVTGVPREKLIDTDFSNYFTEPKKAQEGYRQVFEKGFVADYPLTIKHKNGNLTDVLYNASVYKDDKGNVLGVFAAARDVTEQKWAKDLRIANKELAFQNEEKGKRADELVIANKELAFQNEEKEKRAAEKEKRAAELIIANKELAFQNEEKEKRAAELIVANEELAFQNEEKEKRAAELIIANEELAFQNEEKEKRAAELIIANKELAFQNEEKEKRAAELIVANKELLAFTYISSHDLQEPLRKIQTFVTIILENENKNLSENGKYNFQRMQLAAGRMQQLIDDLLAFSRISTTELKFEKTDMGIIAEEVKAELKDTIQEKHATIETTELCSANIIAFQFRQLVYNLVSNALKFSRHDVPSHIIIKSSIIKGNEVKTQNFASLSPEKNYCHIMIKDNGIGFEPHFSERIFEVFQKLHGKEVYGGTGIGLAIVKKIVENHNGTITATSELNKGAQFDIYIPA